METQHTHTANELLYFDHWTSEVIGKRCKNTDWNQQI